MSGIHRTSSLCNQKYGTIQFGKSIITGQEDFEMRRFVGVEEEEEPAAKVQRISNTTPMVREFPVEQLDPNTGEILGRFNIFSDAVYRVYPDQNPDHMMHHALLSYHVSQGRLLGHIYKGYLWRFTGYVSSLNDNSRFFHVTLPEAPISPKASTEVPTSTIVARKVDHPTTTTGNQSFGGGANASVELSVRGHGVVLVTMDQAWMIVTAPRAT
jgi:hypothetical protein